MDFRRMVACAGVSLWPMMAAAAQPAAPQGGPGGIDRLVNAIERAVEAGDGDALRALARPDVRVATFSEFVQSMTFPKVVHSAVEEPERLPPPAGPGRPLPGKPDEPG